MSSPLKPSVKLRLAFNNYNRCAFPNCNRQLTEKATAEDQGAILGMAEHVRGEKPGSARHDPDFPEDEVNGYDNLIYLCGDHHTLIAAPGGDPFGRCERLRPTLGRDGARLHPPGRCLRRPRGRRVALAGSRWSRPGRHRGGGTAWTDGADRVWGPPRQVIRAKAFR